MLLIGRELPQQRRYIETGMDSRPELDTVIRLNQPIWTHPHWHADRWHQTGPGAWVPRPDLEQIRIVEHFCLAARWPAAPILRLHRDRDRSGSTSNPSPHVESHWRAVLGERWWTTHQRYVRLQIIPG